MTFEWDQKKNEANVKRHGISFSTASQVFDDPNLVINENIDADEQRYDVIGMTKKMVLLLVVFVDRSREETEPVYRIISARKAERFEEIIYASYLS